MKLTTVTFLRDSESSSSSLPMPGTIYIGYELEQLEGIVSHRLPVQSGEKLDPAGPGPLQLEAGRWGWVQVHALLGQVPSRSCIRSSLSYQC